VLVADLRLLGQLGLDVLLPQELSALAVEADEMPLEAVRKILSPTTMGLDVPGPGSAVFQTTCSVALQLAGSDFSALTP
jgi:hypothetical protein